VSEPYSQIRCSQRLSGAPFDLCCSQDRKVTLINIFIFQGGLPYEKVEDAHRKIPFQPRIGMYFIHMYITYMYITGFIPFFRKKISGPFQDSD